MQTELFDDAASAQGDGTDPYDELRHEARALTEQYAISGDHAFELMVAYGSRIAALGHLRQRWWLGEVQMREPPLPA